MYHTDSAFRGLDPPIVSAIAKKFAPKRIESHDKSEAWWPQYTLSRLDWKVHPTWLLPEGG